MCSSDLRTGGRAFRRPSRACRATCSCRATVRRCDWRAPLTGKELYLNGLNSGSRPSQAALAKAQEKKATIEAVRQEVYDQGVREKLNQIEASRKKGKAKYIPESILKRPEPNLPISIEGEPINLRFKESGKLQDKFKEENPQALVDVFGKGGKLTKTQLNWLKGLGAITEDNVPVMGAVDVAVKEIQKLGASVDKNPSYEMFKSYDFVKKIMDASKDKFVLALREGKKGKAIDPETIFYSQLKDLIDQIDARRKENIDLGSALTLDMPEAPYIEAGAVETGKLTEAEKLTEEEKPSAVISQIGRAHV